MNIQVQHIQPLRFGRYATESEKTRISQLVRELMPGQKVDPRFVFVNKELRIPLFGWRIPFITNLALFLGHARDLWRVASYCTKNKVEDVQITQLMTNLKYPSLMAHAKEGALNKLKREHPYLKFDVKEVEYEDQVLVSWGCKDFMSRFINKNKRKG